MDGKGKLGVIAGAVGTLAAVNMIRAAKFKPQPVESIPMEAERVNIERYTQNLSDAIKIKTISNVDDDKVDWEEFNRLHKLFEERYPLIHQKLKREEVGKASLLYTWEGKNPDLDPIALLGHQDVVPVTEGTEGDWTHDPFGGEIADGYLWGRGSVDMKNHLIGVLESVETLLEDGFEPERTVYLCLGHNEEIVASKDSGAKRIADLLKSRGVHLDSVIDEGGAILSVKVPGVIDKHLAGIGIAEKGYCDFEISVTSKGGHSSTPPNHTAMGELAKAIRDVENNQFKSEISPLVDDMITRMGKNSTFLARNIFCNAKFMKPVVKKIFSSIPAAASFVRTTTAVTMAQGSPAANVLPQKASAVVNFRILPGMTIADVEAHLKKVIKLKRCEIKLLGGNEPSHVSPTDSRAFRAIESICATMDKDSFVTPYLVMGGTDAKNYQDICENVYRYSPFLLNLELISTTHGTNERILTSSFENALVFFKRYIKTLAGE